MLSFQSLFEYRANFFWRISGTIISSLILYVFWVAVLGSGFTQSNYTATSIGLYFLFVSFIDSFTAASFTDFSDPIHRGDLSMDLTKPYSFFAKNFSSLLPDRLVILVVSSSIYLAVRLSGTPHTLGILSILISTLSVFLALLMRFFINAAVGSLAFWFNKVYGFWYLFSNLGGLFSGQLIPIEFLPSSLVILSNYLPFRYLIYFPAQNLLGATPSTATFPGLFMQILWTVLSFLLCQLIWSRGLKVFDSVGR